MDKGGAHLSGITSLMNKQHINQNADIDQIERIVLNNNNVAEPKKEDYNLEVNKLAKELGLDFGTGLKIVVLDDEASIKAPPSVKSNKSNCSHCSKCSKCSQRNPHTHNKDVPYRSTREDTYKPREDTYRSREDTYKPYSTERHKDNVKEDVVETDEHYKKSKVMEVMGDLRKEHKTGFSMNVERTRDTKSNKIEQICNIISSLDEEGVDVKSFNIPSTDASMEEIDSILNLVNMKMNRTRYSSMFEDIVIGAAEFMESKLDGTRNIPPFNWKPDYTGYSNTVSVKLHRMRYETSKLVGNGMEKLNIGSTTRILMELLPSLVLYPKTNANHRKKSDNVAGSFGNIRGKLENDWDALNKV
jgi:hypothetical protein